MKYQQLTESKRYQITIFLSEKKYTISEIAQLIGVHRSTVYREIRCNRVVDGYLTSSAQCLTEERCRAAAKRHIDTGT
ncbi:HTH domain-containing protein [Xenorhabdus sp. Reich]|uniref:HTH domain-containing protein n=1 Tax=Xenorhabdus littoralis TaxID=2582835 RepID=A0ABU4SHM6_9GAMM|nr:HTH domain-containing protein [Xenorhabdus sp. Reich]